MEDFKGTKGKWEVDGYAYDVVSTANSLWTIAEIHDGSRNEDVEVIKANAQLIAAAPEMLEALNKFLMMFGEYDMRPEDELHEYASEVRDILDKALGVNNGEKN